MYEMDREPISGKYLNFFRFNPMFKEALGPTNGYQGFLSEGSHNLNRTPQLHLILTLG